MVAHTLQTLRRPRKPSRMLTVRGTLVRLEDGRSLEYLDQADYVRRVREHDPDVDNDEVFWVPHHDLLPYLTRADVAATGDQDR